MNKYNYSRSLWAEWSRQTSNSCGFVELLTENMIAIIIRKSLNLARYKRIEKNILFVTLKCKSFLIDGVPKIFRRVPSLARVPLVRHPWARRSTFDADSLRVN
ncbi:hypothetical protein TNCV_1643671 [Trichonephila clavipes]|nr:hypothetical protein TNCV_1643671 [Trichonephila clavipes]